MNKVKWLVMLLVFGVIIGVIMVNSSVAYAVVLKGPEFSDNDILDKGELFVVGYNKTHGFSKQLKAWWVYSYFSGDPHYTAYYEVPDDGSTWEINGIAMCYGFDRDSDLGITGMDGVKSSEWSTTVTTSGTFTGVSIGQAVHEAKAAKDWAHWGKDAADAAKTAANTASTNASAAKTSADAASTNASAAKIEAINAKNAANTASTNASAAKTEATNAKNAANTASTNASAAKTEAINAKNAANTASSRVWDATESKSAATLAKEARDKANAALTEINNVKTTVNNIQASVGPVIQKVATANAATCTQGTSIPVMVQASGATEFRARADTGSWTAWTPVGSSVTVTGITGTGAHVIYVEARNVAGATATGQMTMFKL